MVVTHRLSSEVTNVPSIKARIISHSLSVLTGRVAKIQPFPASVNSTAVVPQGGEANASATTSPPKILVLFTCSYFPGELLVLHYCLQTQRLLLLADHCPTCKTVTAESSWIYCSSQDHTDASAIAKGKGNGTFSSAGI